MTHLQTLRRYYDPATLRAWIARYESSYTTDKRAEQVTRRRRVLATLEEDANLEPSPPIPETPKTAPRRANFDDYAQDA